MTKEPAECEKEFKSKYKNCGVMCVAYPDKSFINEDLDIEVWSEEEAMAEASHFVSKSRGRCSILPKEYLENAEFKKEFFLPAFFNKAVVYYNKTFNIYVVDIEIINHFIEFLNERRGSNLPAVAKMRVDGSTFTEAVPMTRDELMDKEGTDDVELINAGRSEEERVELVEASINIKTLGTEIFDSGEAAMYVAREMTYNLVGEPKDAVKLAK
jgi:hypothetical protein